MLQIRTTINNNFVYLDLYKNEPVFLSLSFAELQDITKKNSNFSNAFSLPGSKNNNDTFNFFYDLNSVPTDFNPNNKFEAELLWDGYEIMTGYIRLNSVSISNGEIIYSVTFYNQIGDLMANIGDKFLYDLDLDYLSHPYSEQVILQSNLDPNLFPLTGTTNYSYQNGKTMWGLFNIGYNYLSGNTVFATSTPLVQFTPVINGENYDPVFGNFDSPQTPVRDYYYKPAIQVKELYEQIVREAGYIVESNFFDTSYFKNFYLPLKFADETIYAKNAIPPCYTVTAATVTGSPVLSVNQSTGVTCNTLGWVAGGALPYELVIPSGNTGVYTFRFTFSARATTPCPSGSSNNLSFFFEDQFSTSLVYSNIFCETGFTTTVSIEQQFVFTGQSVINFYFNVSNVEVTNYKQEIIDGPRFIPNGAIIDYSIEFPENDYKQLDFITSINKYFNFVVVPNPDKPSNLIIEPIIDYIGKGEVLDWTTKVDFNETQNLYPTSALLNGTLAYNFKLDQDYTNQDFNSQANRIFGTDNVLLNLQYKDSITNFDLIFSSPIDITINNAFVPLITIPSMSKLKQIDVSGTTRQTFVPFKILPKLVYRGVTLPNDNYGYFGTSAYTANPDCATSVTIDVTFAGYITYTTCTNEQITNYYAIGTYVLTNPNCIISNSIQPSTSYFFPFAAFTIVSIGTSCTPTNVYSNYQYYYMNNNQMDRWTNINRFTTYPFNYNNFSHYTNFRGEDKTNVTPSEYSFIANDLYNIYYEDYVNDIISEENKIYTCKIYLNPQDIKRLTWDERILINNTYFRINKISRFNALEPSICDIELVKITKTYTPHPVKYYRFQACPCVCLTYQVLNNNPTNGMTVLYTDCYGDSQTIILPPLASTSQFCACEDSVTTEGGTPEINLIGPCTPDPPASGGTSVYSNSDLMYHAYAYVGNKVKLYDDSLNYLGCYNVLLDDYNPLNDYQHYYFSSAYTANLVGVYNDCNCTIRSQFVVVQEEPPLTPFFYYIGYDCNDLSVSYQFRSTGSTLNPSGVYRISNSGTSQTICVTNIESNYLQLTDWLEVASFVSCEACLIVPTPTPTPTPVSCVCKSYIISNFSEEASTQVNWNNCDLTFGGAILGPQTSISICACEGTVVAIGGTPVIQDRGICGAPTPTPTPTPTCAFKQWLITTCSSTCLLGKCICTFGGNITVFTDCSVTNITSPGTRIYRNSSFSIPFIGFFRLGGSIWESNGTTVIVKCTLGGPC